MLTTIFDSTTKFAEIVNRITIANNTYDKVMSIASLHNKVSENNRYFQFIDFTSKYKEVLSNIKSCESFPSIDYLSPPKIFTYTNSIGMSKTVVDGLQRINLKKSLQDFETLAAIKERENQEKRRTQEKLHEELTGIYLNTDKSNFSRIVTRESIDALNKIIDVDFAYHHYSPLSLYEQIVFRHLDECLYTEQEIKKNEKFINFLKAIKSVLNKVFKRFQINKREFIRKITSLDFKNLDDTHSFALISLRY